MQAFAVLQPHSSCSQPSRVGSAGVERDLWDHLAEAGRAPADVLGQPAEVLHGVVEVRGEKDPLAGLLDLVLDPREASHAAGNGQHHASELAQKALELALGARPAASGEGVEQLEYQQKSIIRTLKSEGYLTFNPYAQHIANRFQYIATVDVPTITLSL